MELFLFFRKKSLRDAMRLKYFRWNTRKLFQNGAHCFDVIFLFLYTGAIERDHISISGCTNTADAFQFFFKNISNEYYTNWPRNLLAHPYKSKYKNKVATLFLLGFISFVRITQRREYRIYILCHCWNKIQGIFHRFYFYWRKKYYAAGA